MKTIAVGDVHGCFSELLQLLTHINTRFEDETRRDELRFVFIGDYVDRGPRSKEVVQYLLDWQDRNKDQIICLKGNHEDMILRGIYDYASDNWGPIRTYDHQGIVSIPSEHREWMQQLPLFYVDPDVSSRIFVHAGIDRTKQMEEQVSAEMMWVREPFLWDNRDCGRYIIHGHTPISTCFPQILDNRCNLDTGACFERGVLSAAIFDDTQAEPIAVMNHLGEYHKVRNKNIIIVKEDRLYS